MRRLSLDDIAGICDRHERFCRGLPGGVRAMFAHCDLSDADLSRRILADADFTGARMIAVNLSEAILDRAIFAGADLSEANLHRAAMRRADLKGARLNRANLSMVDMVEADLSPGGAPFSGSKRAVEATRTDLSGANLSRCKLMGIRASQANFDGALLVGCKLSHADLRTASLAGADLKGAIVDHAELNGANLTDAVLVGVNLSAAKLGSASLASALRDPDPRSSEGRAIIERMRIHEAWVTSGGQDGKPAAFDGADVRVLATLAGYDLSAVSAKGAVFYGLDMRRIKLVGCNLENADLRHCDLRDADLRGARFRGARLDGANLTNARLDALNLSGGRRLEVDFTDASLRDTVMPAGSERKALAS